MGAVCGSIAVATPLIADADSVEGKTAVTTTSVGDATTSALNKVAPLSSARCRTAAKNIA
jgi:hypothetical protein